MTFHACQPSLTSDPTTVEVMTVAKWDDLAAFLSSTSSAWTDIIDAHCVGGDTNVYGPAAGDVIAAVEGVFGGGREGFDVNARDTNVGYVLHPQAATVF